jgi:RNA polymerase sigma-70 factor, ECF subfamily
VVITSETAVDQLASGPAEVVYDSSFEAFVKAQSLSLLRRAYLLMGDQQLAEDLVQTALARVALRWSSVAARGDPMPYVRTAVVRTAITWRRRRWWGEVPTAQLPERAVVEGLEAIDGRDRVRRALLQLPARQRAAVVLRFYDDLSEVDTAKALGCSVGTVKSQTAKGLARLRAALGPESVESESAESIEPRGRT